MRRLTLMLSLPAILVAAGPVDVSIPTADGYVMSGSLTVPSTRGKHPVVILAHAFRTDRSNWTPLVDRLNNKGIATLALDLRGHGTSSNQPGAANQELVPSDLVKAAAWVRKQRGINARRVGLAGAGEGGFAVLMAAQQIQPDTLLVLGASGAEAFGPGAQNRMFGSVNRSRGALMAFYSLNDKESEQNLDPLRSRFGVNIRSFEGTRRGFEFLDAHAETMAVYFGEYLLHPHSGRAVAKPTQVPAEGSTDLNAVAPTTPTP